MSTSANLDSTSVSIDPGSEAVVPLQIRNDSGIVEAYQLEVVGVPAQWTVVEPAAVSLYPGNATTARVLFRPPRSAQVPAGELPFGVRVVPTENPHHTVVPEGIVQILPFTDTSAEIIPRNSRGRLAGKHRVAIDNRGNVPLPVMLTGTDPNDALEYSLRPESANVGPGHADFSNLKVRSRKRLWTGQPITHPFQVAVAPSGGAPVVLDATYVQEPLIPRWLGRAALVALALAVALVALWFALVRPAVQSAAKEQAEKTAVKAEENAKAAQESAAAAQTQAAAAKKVSEDVAKKTGNAAAAAAAAAEADAAVQTVPKPFLERLEVSLGAGKNNSGDPEEIVVPKKESLELTDILLQNPQGDSGELVVMKNDDVVFRFGLENYRTDDQHFQTPLVFTAGDKLVMVVNCETPGKNRPGETTAACRPAISVMGTLQVPKPPKPPKP
jgi:hypothetical protein